MPTTDDRLRISQVATLLDRRPNTIRGWERDKILPAKFLSKRDDRGWRYWTPKQVDGIRKWLVDNDVRPGNAFAHYKPSLEQVAAHIAKIRKANEEE